jgi:hypothetical protein
MWHVLGGEKFCILVEKHERKRLIIIIIIMDFLVRVGRHCLDESGLD